jgi:hypothetical protein
LGRAICAWRRAQELAPRDPDVRANLQFARNHAGLGAPALPGVPWARWTARLTVNEWTVLSSLAVAFLFILLTVRQVRPALKKSSNGLAWTLAAASVCGLTCLGLALDARYGTQSSVVIVPESVLRLAVPTTEAATVLTAHDGAELLVTDRKPRLARSVRRRQTQAAGCRKPKSFLRRRFWSVSVTGSSPEDGLSQAQQARSVASARCWRRTLSASRRTASFVLIRPLKYTHILFYIEC